MYLFQNLVVQLWNSFLPLPFPSFPCSNMFPVAFTRTFEFMTPTSILELAITPTFKQFYPPPILTEHPIWYSLDANFFITLWGILYGLHWWYFQNSPLFQEIVAHGEKQLIELIPQHPIPFDILKNDLFDHFLILLYHGTIKTQPFNEGWLDWSKTTLHALVFPGSNSYYHLKVLWLLTLAITTNAMNVCLIYPNSTDNQMIKLGRRATMKGSFNTGRGLWRRRNLCWGQLNLDRAYCYVFTILYFHFTISLSPLLNLLAPRTYGYTCSCLMTHLFLHLWLIHFLIYDSLSRYINK